jgi:hypothetical protein
LRLIACRCHADRCRCVSRETARISWQGAAAVQNPVRHQHTAKPLKPEFDFKLARGLFVNARRQ